MATDDHTPHRPPDGTMLQFTKPCPNNSAQQPFRPPLTKCPYVHCPHCLDTRPPVPSASPQGPTTRTRGSIATVWPPSASLTT